MIDNVNQSVSKELEIGADIVRQLRSNGLSYGKATTALQYAQTLVQKIGYMELADLPIADGEINAVFNPDHLILSSTKIAGERPQSPE